MFAQGSFQITVRDGLRIPQLKARLSEAADYALNEVAHRLLADSKMFVPVLTGRLKDSGVIIDVPNLDQALNMARVVYNTEYAATQHEDPYWHPSLGFHGEAKYLALPIQYFGQFYQSLFEYEFKRYLELKGDV